MHEQQAYSFAQFSDIAKHGTIAPPLDPKTFDTRRIILKRSKRL